MRKEFCTAGPVKADIHYLVPPLGRVDFEALQNLVDARKYFVIHAPRQTGKTSCLYAIAEELNRSGRYKALYVNVEPGQAARDDVAIAMRAIVSAVAARAARYLADPFPAQVREQSLVESGSAGALNWLLSAWAANSALPLVLLFDEVDALVGDTLISFLRQIRAGYPDRPDNFPQSVILCGVRDVRDYRIHGTKEVITGGSAFNIKAESLRLGDFTQDDVKSLYLQHTAETGQAFDDAVFPLVWNMTRGQPWLVNALAYEACFRMKEGTDRRNPITADVIDQAKENLILRRDTHLDQLADKLREDRVRRVIQPIIAGTEREGAESDDDAQYAIDLGLVRRTRDGLEIANDIYKEVVPRHLNFEVQSDFGNIERTEWYVAADGSLDMDKLLVAFQQFYRENSEVWLGRFLYEEAGPQLLLQAFLQRIVNGGGRIDREYGLGRRRTDLLVQWNFPGGVQRVVIELKMLHGTVERTLERGLAQTADYMRRVGTAHGHLVIFDRRKEVDWDTKIFRRQEGPITVWGM